VVRSRQPFDTSLRASTAPPSIRLLTILETVDSAPFNPDFGLKRTGKLDPANWLFQCLAIPGCTELNPPILSTINGLQGRRSIKIGTYSHRLIATCGT